MSAIFLLQLSLTYSPIKCVTWCAPRGVSLHQVWSWYDHPLPSYSVISADTLRDLVTLTFDLLSLVSGHTWRVTCSTPPPSLKILRLSFRELWVLTSPIGYHWQERAFGGKISLGRGRPLPTCWYHSKVNWLRYNFAADSFYIMKLCRRLFVLYCRSRPKDDKSRHFYPHFEEVRGGVEPWWMARWNARAEFLLSVIELLFLSLTVEALQSKMCKNSLPSGVGRSLGAKFQGKGLSMGNIFWFVQN